MSEDFDGLSPDPENSKNPLNKMSLEERRVLVYKYYLQNIPQGKIAEILNAHRNTIVQDLRHLRKGGAEEIVGLRKKTDEEVGDHLSVLKHVEGEALIQYELAGDDKPLKKGYLELVLKSRMERIALEFKSGIIPIVDKRISTGQTPVDKESDLVDNMVDMNRDDILKILDEVETKNKRSKTG